jgi:hypothetical protein
LSPTSEMYGPEPGGGAARTDAGPRGLPGRAGRRLLQLVKRPEFVTDLLQIVKGVIAATGAWWLAVFVVVIIDDVASSRQAREATSRNPKA